MAIAGGMIYAGGSFSSIGGQARNKIAALNTTTGTPTDWNPNLNLYGSVFDLLDVTVSGGTVYVRVLFTSSGGQPRHDVVALDAASGLATAWKPNANGNVFALAIAGGTIYAGGSFTSIGGQVRNYLTALDASTGAVMAWNPNANGNIYALAVSGGTVYVGGKFTSIGGQTRNGLAALDASSGAVKAWNPNAGSISPYSPYVRALAISGSTVYARGGFTSIGGQARNCLVALDASSGAVTAWNPNASGEFINTDGMEIYALAVSGGTAYIGGDFINIGGQPQPGFAQFDSRNGARDWRGYP